MSSCRASAKSPRFTFAFALLLLLAQTASTQQRADQDAEVTRIRTAIAAMGRQWNADVLASTAALYGGLHRQRSQAGLRQVRDLAYGPDPAHRLDLFVPDQGFDEPGPVLVFLHDSDAFATGRILPGTDELLYSNVARAIARAGGVGINADYRPGARTLTDGTEDIGLLVRWVQVNVPRHGGDPAAILFVGHGEGAVRLAAYLLDPARQTGTSTGIAGAVLSGGTFDREDLWRRLDAMPAGASLPPLVLWSAELDPVQSGVEALRTRLCARQLSCPSVEELRGHNRASALMSFDTADGAALGLLARFYHLAVQK